MSTKLPRALFRDLPVGAYLIGSIGFFFTPQRLWIKASNDLESNCVWFQNPADHLTRSCPLDQEVSILYSDVIYDFQTGADTPYNVHGEEVIP